jgi:hypothetical protein
MLSVYILGLLAGGLLLDASVVEAQPTTRVSEGSGVEQGNLDSLDPSVSADGRFVAFASSAFNLVPCDTNGTLDVFVHDRHTGETTRVSVDSNGKQGNSASASPSISADGRFVAFLSLASNLVRGDTNGTQDVFVHDRDTGETTRVNVDSNGNEATNESARPSISADGRFVAFGSLASDLVPCDTNDANDVFVHEFLSVINDLVSLDDVKVSLDPAPVPGGPAGTFTITAVFANTSSTPIENPFFQVTELTGGNLLLNADGGARGIGATLTPDVGDDGVLEVGEEMTVEFDIGLQTKTRFSFTVDLLVQGGIPSSP